MKSGAYGGAPLSKEETLTDLELQFVNIRQSQQHTGELYEQLGTRKNIKHNRADHGHRSLK